MSELLQVDKPGIGIARFGLPRQALPDWKDNSTLLLDLAMPLSLMRSLHGRRSCREQCQL